MKKSQLVMTMVLSIIVGITAIYGLFNTGAYSQETRNWLVQSMAQDWIDLVVVVPLLIISGYFAFRGRVAAKLIWLGTLLFTVYSFLIYSFMVHFNSMFLFYVTALGISFYLVIISLSTTDYEKIKNNFIETWTRKFTANALITLGTVFYLVWLKDIIPNVLNGTIPSSMQEAGLFTNGVYVIDIAFYLPLLIASGYYLRKQRAIGYTLAGASMVFSVIMMANIAFIVFFVGFKGLPTDASISYLFGTLCLLFAVVTAKYLAAFKNKQIIP